MGTGHRKHKSRNQHEGKGSVHESKNTQDRYHKKKGFKGKEDCEICLNENLVDVQSLKLQDLNMEGHNALNSHQPLEVESEVNGEACQYEDMFEREGGSITKLCLLYNNVITLNLLVIEASGVCLSVDSFSTVELPYCVPNVGFGSLGSKCYVIGGSVYLHGKGLKFPRNVFVCDLDRRVKSWKKGPMLNGGKPVPIIVTVNEKLYALAGESSLWAEPQEKLENVFEVFDPKCGIWRVLPNPPFLFLYKRCSQPEFKGNTVIGSVIYLQIGDSSDRNLYAFNVDSEEWTEYSSVGDGGFFASGSDDLILHNLRVGDFYRKADVVDYLLFQTSKKAVEKLNVYAYDLTSKNLGCEFHNSNRSEFSSGEDEDPYAKSIEATKWENRYKAHDYNEETYVLMVDDDLMTVPVLGLTLIDRSIPPDSTFSSFVTHLGDNLFSLVSTSLSSHSIECNYIQIVKVCVFEASFIELTDEIKFNSRYVAGYNVREVTRVNPELGMFTAWCKVPNDGRQSQFRRPRQVVHKKTFQRYVRHVNIPQY